ncbi:MAG: AAA family ATPase [Gemmataceae bacterium]
MNVKQLLDNADQLAWKNSQVSTNAHLLAVLLKSCSHASYFQVRDCLDKLHTGFYPRLGNIEQNQSPGSQTRSYEQQNLREYLSPKDDETSDQNANALLLSLFEFGEAHFQSHPGRDGTLEIALKILQAHGLTKDFFTQPIEEGVIKELGFGRWYEPTQADLPAMYGRESDLVRHHGLLEFAISQDRPYFLTGDKGVGKTLFLRHLLARVFRRNQRSKRIAWITPTDFWRRQEAVGEKMEALFQLILEDESILPIFDDLDQLTREPTLHAELDRRLGVFFRSQKRALVVGCRSEGARGSTLLSALRPYRLSSLSREATLELLRVTWRQWFGDTSVWQGEIEPENGTSEFTAYLLETLDERYPGSPLPHQALELLKGVLVQAQIRRFRDPTSPSSVVRKDVENHVTVDLGLNPEVAGQNKRDFYSCLLNNLKQEVFGQDHVVEQVCQVLYAKAVAPPREWPRGRFLFVGPPGTGKTHLGKSLAKHLGYGTEAFYEFNMGEYSGEGARNRFIGSDPGYRHAMETFTIFEAVRQTPACIVLLDEIDRADASIQDILLGLLEGRGRDAFGTTHKFDQVIFILTTNQGQEQIEKEYQESLKQGRSRQKITETFSSRALRSLLISRALSVGEGTILAFLQENMGTLSRRFASQEDKTAAAQEYAVLKQTWQLLSYDNSKSILDRALLDRIDFIFPFFPLDEENLVRVLDLQLARVGWSDADERLRQTMLKEVLEEKERGRAVIRIVEGYKNREPRFNLFAQEENLA